MYTELHCHSAFSFLDGTSPPEVLAQRAAQLGCPALALTDHNGLYGSMAFAQAAKHLGLQPITGAETTLLDGTHITLLAETPQGYANLCRMITETHLGREDRRDPRLDFESLVPPGRSDRAVRLPSLPPRRGEPSSRATCSTPTSSTSSGSWTSMRCGRSPS